MSGHQDPRVTMQQALGEQELSDEVTPSFLGNLQESAPFTLDDLQAAMTRAWMPTESDVAHAEVAELATLSRIAIPETKTEADIRRLGLFPSAAFTGLTIVLDRDMPPDVIRLVCWDGSTASYNVATGAAWVSDPETGAQA